LAWKVNFWSRLKDGERAYKLYRRLLHQHLTQKNKEWWQINNDILFATLLPVIIFIITEYRESYLRSKVIIDLKNIFKTHLNNLLDKSLPLLIASNQPYHSKNNTDTL
tara:strand:+ start:8884 stop:9207 length:324 start_codon:yes stop_codon:yes gene_type:complete